MKPELLRVFDALMTAGVNGVLQGLLLLVLLALGLRWIGRRLNATTRHAVYSVALVFLVALVCAHGLRQFTAIHHAIDTKAGLTANSDPDSAATRRDSPGRDPASQTKKLSPLKFVFLPLPPESTLVPGPTNGVLEAVVPFSLEAPWITRTAELVPISEVDEQAKHRSLFAQDREPHAQEAAVNLAGGAPDQDSSPESTHSRALADSQAIPPLAQAILDAASVIEAAAAEEQPTTWDIAKDWLARFSTVLLDPISFKLTAASWFPRNLSLAVLSVFLLVAVYRVGSVASRLRMIRRLKADALEPTPELNELFSRLYAQTKTKRKVTLGLWHTQKSAILVGFAHPKILLPADCDVREAELVLRHELAHVNRRDDWANLGQQLVQATFFFHPGVWWLCRQLSLEREIACDDSVLTQSSPRSYALLLATLAGRMRGSPALLAPGVSTNKSQLQQRIDMILDTHRNTSLRLAKTRLGLISSAAACVALAAIYTAPRIVFAQSQAAEGTAPATPAATPVPGAAIFAHAPVALAGEVTAANDDPTTSAPAAVSTGPKYKTLAPLAVPAAPPALPSGGVIALTPPPPAAPNAPMVLVSPTPGAPPLAALAGNSGIVTYEPVPTPRHKDTSDMSVEERLDRLERMIQSLSSKKEYKVWQPDFKWDAQLKMNGMDPKQMQSLQEFARAQADMARKQAEMARQQLEMARQHAADPQQMERLKAEIDRETARAGEEMKRAARELERAMREQQPHPRKPESGDAAPRKRNFNKDASRQQLEGLRRQHETLERQMERLDRQIEELERSQEEVEQQDEDQGPEQAENQLKQESRDNQQNKPAAK